MPAATKATSSAGAELPMVKLLLENGANVDAKDSKERTLLHLAAGWQ
jgi:ankyrin repeat protein